MIAVDTNILVYSHCEDVQFYPEAEKAIAFLANGTNPWAIPWPCIHEFLAVVTHPKLTHPPTPLSMAFEVVESWLASPSLVLLSEGTDHYTTLRTVALSGQITGSKLYDSKIAAICLDSGVKELWTADRDFSRFPSLKTRNPLIS